MSDDGIDFKPKTISPVAATDSGQIDFRPKSLTASTETQGAGTNITPSDAISFGRSLLPTKEQVPEIVGSMVGGFARTTPMGMALSAGGAAAGEAVRQAIFENKPLTPQQRLEKLLGAGARGAVGEVGGRAIGKLFAPFSGNVTPEIAAGTKAAEEAGITPPLSTMTNSPMVQGMERAAEYTPFGAAITNQKVKALQDFSKYAQSVGSEISPEKPPQLTGTLAKEQLQGFVDRFNETKDKLYNAVMPMLKDKVAQVDDTISTLEDIIKRREGLGQPEGIGQLKDWLSKLKGSKGFNIQTNEGIPGMLTPPEIKAVPDIPGAINTFDGLRKFRTNVGARTKFGDPATSGLQSDMKQLYGAITNDLDNSVKAVSPENYAALKQADEVYQIGKSTLKSKVFKALSNLNPEDMYKAVIIPKSPTNVDLGREILGNDTFQEISRQWFDGIVNASTKDGIVSPLKLSNQLQRYGDTVGKVFEDRPEVMAQINKLQSIASLLSKGKDVTSGSQTAYIGSMFAEILGTIYGLVNRPIETGAAVAATGLGVAGLKSGIGRKLLTTGYPAAGKIAERITQPAAELGAQKLNQLFGNQ